MLVSAISGYADGKPVSVINYIINEIDINGCIIKAASIGAVCTQEDYIQMQKNT